MTWGEVANLIAEIATAVAVIIAVISLRQAKAQAQTAFEDSLVAEYRKIIHRVPYKALIGQKVSGYKESDALSDIYNYIDFTNEQIILRSKGRITKSTWNEWVEGIQSNLESKFIKGVWNKIQAEIGRAHV